MTPAPHRKGMRFYCQLGHSAVLAGRLAQDRGNATGNGEGYLGEVFKADQSTRSGSGRGMGGVFGGALNAPRLRGGAAVAPRGARELSPGRRHSREVSHWLLTVGPVLETPSQAGPASRQDCELEVNSFLLQHPHLRPPAATSQPQFFHQ